MRRLLKVQYSYPLIANYSLSPFFFITVFYDRLSLHAAVADIHQGFLLLLFSPSITVIIT